MKKGKILAILGFVLLLCLFKQNIFAQAGMKWATNGNSINSGEFIGTTNNLPLQIKVNNALALQIEPDGIIVLRGYSHNGEGLLSFNMDGKVIPINFPNDPTQILNGMGTWSPISSLSGWKLSGNDIVQITSGNVGIGTTNPIFKLDVLGSVRISQNLYVGGGIVISEKVNATKEVLTEQLKSSSITADSILMDSTKAFYGYSKFAGDVKLENKLDVMGNVRVSGNLYTSGSSTTSGNVSANSINTSYLNVSGSTSFQDLQVNGNVHVSSKVFASAYSSNSPLIFEAPAGTERMRIDDISGNVGIGTNVPQTKLHVYGNENDNVAIRLQKIYSGQGIPTTTWDMEALSGGKLIYVTPDYNAPVLSLTKTGKVGVGTDNPLANFHIKGFTDGGLAPGGGGTGEGGNGDPSSLSAVLRIEDNVINSFNNRTVSWDYTVSGLQQKMLISNNINGTTNYVMTFKENGDCGIGTTTPGAKLDIVGNLKVSSLAPTTGNNIVQVGTNGILTSTPFADAGVGLWQQIGNDIYNTNTDGNVGIGTNLSNAKLSIEGYSINSPIVNIFDSLNPTENTGFNIFQIQKLYPSDVIGNPPVRSTCFSIADTGNVSIGVSVHNNQPIPIQKLEVWGAIKISSAATTSPSSGTIEYNNGDFFGYTANGKKALRGPWCESPANVNNIFYNGGNVGIGTNDPQSALHIKGNILLEGIDGTVIHFKKTSANADAFMGYSNFNDDFYISNIPANLIIKAQGNIGIGIMPGQPSPSEKLEVVGNTKINGNSFLMGNVGINTTDIPDGYNLAVEGNIICNKVRVVSDIHGPDYVFENNYKLMPLNEVEKFIAQYKHLPEVASAEEMSKNGIQIDEMNFLLLKKIEELTLHLIQQQKEINDLKNMILK